MNNIEYELIDITFEPLVEEERGMVSEDGPVDDTIVYDADGVPMGDSREEIKIRERLIKNFLKDWGERHPERCVRNDALADDIYIKGISVIEAVEHSAKSYLSTRAVMMLDDVLKKSLPVRRVPIKKAIKIKHHLLIC